MDTSGAGPQQYGSTYHNLNLKSPLLVPSSSSKDAPSPMRSESNDGTISLRSSLQSSKSGTLKLEMPTRDVDDLNESHYYQPKSDDELGFPFLSDISRKPNEHIHTPAQYRLDYSNIPSNEMYFGFLGSQESYVDTDHTHELSSQAYFDHEISESLSMQDLSLYQNNAAPMTFSLGQNNALISSKDSMSETMSVGSSKSKPVITGISVTPQSRHARRLYVGGLTSSNSSEDSIKNFLNSVISSALGDDPDSSYILSIYVNQQKCFAFIELNSIELTTACLDLDGILYQNSPLKILRANEYKPELLPPPSFPPIKLNLSGLSFGPSNGMSSSSSQGNSSPLGGIDPQMDQLIKYCSVNTVQRGSIVIIGFPYDDPLRRGISGVCANGATKNRGLAMAPRSIRTALRKFQSGSIVNPEYGIDLSQTRIFDIGDIQVGLSSQDAFKSLAEIIAEIVQRGATPLVIGGSNELASNIAAGLMLVANQQVGVVNVSPSVDSSVLDDSRFYIPRPNYGGKLNCDGRYVHFGAHGNVSSIDQARYVVERGGRVLWFNKDLRVRTSIQDSYPSQYTRGDINSIFKQILHQTASENLPHQAPLRPLCVSFSMSSLSAAYFPGHSQLRSTGLTAEETMDIAMAMGKDKNVVVLSINDFNVEVEEYRSSRVVVDFLYNFFLGYAIRNSPTSGYSPRQANNPAPNVNKPTNRAMPSNAGSGRSTPGSKLPITSPLGQQNYQAFGYNADGIYPPPLPGNMPVLVSRPMPPYNFSSSYGERPSVNQEPPHMASNPPSRSSPIPLQGYSYGNPNANSYAPAPPMSQSYESNASSYLMRDSRPGSKGESPTGYSGPDRYGSMYLPNNGPSLPPYY